MEYLGQLNLDLAIDATLFTFLFYVFVNSVYSLVGDEHNYLSKRSTLSIPNNTRITNHSEY